jgi:hypothetical protein
VIAGPTPAEVLERFTALTGRTPMPPLWALGNQQSRWSYMDADEVRTVAREFRARSIPCDVIYLDIDHMDGYRVFTWDSERFPDPAGLIDELRSDGFRVVVITDPGVKVDEAYPLYVEGRDRGFFCLAPDGREYQNVVWPGLCAFPDFTNPAVREWWGAWHRGLVDVGVAGVWCDMNEPAMFVPDHSTMPEDVVHPGGGHPRLHRDVHNAYGSYMAEAARSGLERLRPDARPFVISRAGYTGLQKHALQWTGDNSSWWEHLWMSMPQLQNLGLSGIAWCGVDVGGFFGDCNGELLARWTEFGAFQPESLGDGDRAAGAVGLRGAVGERLPGHAVAADAAAAVSVHGVRGVPPDRRAGIAAAAVRPSRRPGHLHGRRRVPRGSLAPRRPDHAPRHRASPRLSSGGLVAAVVDEHAHRRASTRAGARAARAAGHVRPRELADSDVARASAHGRGSRLAYLAGVPGSGLRIRGAVRGRG